MRTSIRILSIIVPATAAVIVTAGLGNYRAAEQKLRDMAKEHLDEVSALTAREVSASLKSLRDELTWISRHPIVESMDWDSMKEYLSEITERSSERLTNLMVVERDGSYFFAGKGRVVGWTVSDRKYYRDIMDGEPFSITDPDVSRVTGKMKYTLAVPIGRENGQAAGVLASNISLDILSGMLSDAVGLDGGFRWIVNSRGDVIGSADRDLLLNYNLRTAGGDCEGVANLMDSIASRRHGTGYMMLDDCKLYFATCQPISGTPGWALVSAIPKLQLTSLTDNMLKRMVAALAATVAILVVTVLHMTRRSKAQTPGPREEPQDEDAKDLQKEKQG